MTITTNYKSNTNVDLGLSLITKKYFLDVYESLSSICKTPIILSSGYNAEGQLGDTTTTWRSSPVQQNGFLPNWKKISIGTKSTSILFKGSCFLLTKRAMPKKTNRILYGMLNTWESTPNIWGIKEINSNPTINKAINKDGYVTLKSVKLIYLYKIWIS